MSVMSCSRYGCENIMCDTYVSEVGYICSDCQKEFKEYLKKNGLTPTTEGQITRELKTFMAIEKDTYKEGAEMSVDDFFSERTE